MRVDDYRNVLPYLLTDGLHKRLLYAYVRCIRLPTLFLDVMAHRLLFNFFELGKHPCISFLSFFFETDGELTLH